MATSTVKLYLVPELIDENNYIIEGLSTFLGQRTASPKTITNFQYQRLERSKDIKINFAQKEADVLQRKWNYASIKNSDNDFTAYYFIVGYRQISTETVLLELELDTLNTFYDVFKVKFAPNTFVMRAHVDRFKLIGSSGTTLNLAKIVDRVSEGDSPSFFTENPNGDEITDRKGESETQKHFYLIYRTSEGSPATPAIDLAAEEPLLLSIGQTSGSSYTREYSGMVQDRYLYLLGVFSITFYNVWYINENGVRVEGNKTITSSDSKGFIRFVKTTYNDTTAIRILFYSGADSDSDNMYPIDTTSNSKYTITQGKNLYYSATLTNEASTASTFAYININAGTIQNEYLGAISALDRTDSKIVKVIECPYCPIEYTRIQTEEGYLYRFSDFFEAKSPNENYLRTYDLTKPFPARSIQRNNLTSLFMLDVDSGDLTQRTAHFLEDPKIYNSAYYRLTYYYDSFAYVVKLEDYVPIEGIASPATFRLDVKYKQSSNVSSNLAFDIDAYTDSSYFMGYGEDSFSTILAGSRNNELTLFSSEYLNYLRNGYNYDKKKQAESVAYGAGMAALQTAASVISFALSGVTGGVSAAAGVGLAVGAATSAASVAYNAKQGNDELEQRLKSLRNQSYSVSNIDDLDLFKYYGGNKLRSKVYKVSDTVKAALDSKFRYYGYAVEKFANPYPTYTDSRYYYNFLQCEPVFKETSKSVPGEFLDAITEKLKAGVTIWHSASYAQYVGTLSKEWENFETSILDNI